MPASHPTLAAELMLRHKGVDYRRVNLVNAAHRDRACTRRAASLGAAVPVGPEAARPLIEGRPAERLAREVVPDQPGRMPSVFAT